MLSHLTGATLAALGMHRHANIHTCRHTCTCTHDRMRTGCQQAPAVPRQLLRCAPLSAHRRLPRKSSSMSIFLLTSQ